MEADWSETARLTLPGPSPNAPSTPITAFAFDTAQELLWTGNEYVSEDRFPFRAPDPSRCSSASVRLLAPELAFSDFEVGASDFVLWSRAAEVHVFPWPC